MTEPSPDEIERLKIENELLKEQLETERQEASVVKNVRRRGAIALVLVVLGSALLPVSVLSVWLRNQVLDTDRYLATVEPIGTDPTITAALTDRITLKVSELLDLKGRAADALPDNAQFLAGPIAAGGDAVIREVTTRVLESEQFAELWLAANRSAHELLVAVLTGAEGQVLSASGGEISLNLGALVEAVLERVDEQFGLDLAGRIPAERLNTELVLFDSEQLAEMQTLTAQLNRLVWISVLLALGFLIAAVTVAPDRRRGLRNAGIGVAVSMVLLLVAFSAGRDLYLTNLPSQIHSTDAAEVLFDTLTRYVLQAVRAIAVLGLLLLGASWVTGPSRPAVWVRGLWNRIIGRGSVAASGVELGPVPVWTARHLRALRVAILAAAALVLIAWDRPTGTALVGIAVATLVPLGLVQLVAGAGSESAEEPAEPALDG